MYTKKLKILTICGPFSWRSTMVKLLKNKRWRYLKGIFITYFLTTTQSFRAKITSIDHNLRKFWSNSRFLWNLHNSADLFAHFQLFGGFSGLFRSFLAQIRTFCLGSKLQDFIGLNQDFSGPREPCDCKKVPLSP